MKVHRLQIAYDYSFDLYGLASPVKDYKLAWVLNKVLQLHLTRRKDICYDHTGEASMLISNFQYETEHSEVRLFRNRALGGTGFKKPFLLPDIKEYDYVLQISGAMQQLYPQELLKNLLRVPLVQYVKRFDPLTLKFKENLSF